MLSSCFQTITDKIAMITFQHKKEKAFCLKNESVFAGFIQQSGRGEVRRQSVPNERTGGRMGRELGLTEMAAPPLSFLLSPAFSDSSGSVWPLKKKELPSEEVTSLATVSDKNSWGKDQTFFFPFRAPLVPLKVLYRGSVTKPCAPTLREQGDTKVSRWLRL